MIIGAVFYWRKFSHNAVCLKDFNIFEHIWMHGNSNIVSHWALCCLLNLHRQDMSPLWILGWRDSTWCAHWASWLSFFLPWTMSSEHLAALLCLSSTVPNLTILPALLTCTLLPELCFALSRALWVLLCFIWGTELCWASTFSPVLYCAAGWVVLWVVLCWVECWVVVRIPGFLPQKLPPLSTPLLPCKSNRITQMYEMLRTLVYAIYWLCALWKFWPDHRKEIKSFFDP